MDGQALFQASVPVFLHYLDRLDALALKATPDMLEARLTEDGFSAIENLNIAQGFALRAVLPLVGKPVPDLTIALEGTGDLIARSDVVRRHLSEIDPADFFRAPERQITHRAGDADLTQSAAEFLTCYGLPNFFFHLSIAYATLRQHGAAIGKADFDGFHQYPAGFSFRNAAPTET